MSDLATLRAEHDALSTKLSRFLVVAGSAALLVTLLLANALERVNVDVARAKVDRINALAQQTGVAPRLPFGFRSFGSPRELVTNPDPNQVAEQHQLEREVDTLTREAFAVKAKLLGLDAPMDLRMLLGALPLAMWVTILYVTILTARLRAVLRAGDAILAAAANPDPMDRLRFAPDSAYGAVPRRIGAVAAVAAFAMWLVALAFIAADLTRQFGQDPLVAFAMTLFLITWNVVLAALAVRIRIINDAAVMFGGAPRKSLTLSLFRVIERPVAAVRRLAARLFAPFSFLGGGALVATLAMPLATTKCLDPATGRQLLFRQVGVGWVLAQNAFEGELSWAAYLVALGIALLTIGAGIVAMRRRALPRRLTTTAGGMTALLLGLALFQLVALTLTLLLSFVVPEDQLVQAWLEWLSTILLVPAVVSVVLWRRKRRLSAADFFIVLVAVAPAFVPSLGVILLLGLWGIPVYLAALIIITVAWWSYRPPEAPGTVPAA